jgi:hypothetical protein
MVNPAFAQSSGGVNVILPSVDWQKLIPHIT